MRAHDGLDGLSAFELAKAAGFKGDLKAWLASLRGEPGDKGLDGASAFEVARAAGFQGDVSQWLDSLKGRDGRDGADVDMETVRRQIAAAVAQIPLPKDGADGKDAVLPAPTAWLADYQDGADGLTERVVVKPVDPKFPTWLLLPTRRADGRIRRVQFLPQTA